VASSARSSPRVYRPQGAKQVQLLLEIVIMLGAVDVASRVRARIREIESASGGGAGGANAPRPVPWSNPFDLPFPAWLSHPGLQFATTVLLGFTGIYFLTCRYRHPTWMHCPANATDSPETASERIPNPDPGRYRGPFVQNCRANGAANNCPGGAPGERYYCRIAFWDRFNNVHIRVWSVNCCRCCYFFREGTSCLALHESGGGGQGALAID
jgi:hypothetical protein